MYYFFMDSIMEQSYEIDLRGQTPLQPYVFDCANIGMDGNPGPIYKFQQCNEWWDYLHGLGHPCVMVLDGCHLDSYFDADGLGKHI